MLTFVGLGLYDERSITIQGQEAIRSADRVFAEFYTSRLVGTTLDDLEAYHGVEIEVRDREGVESEPEPILDAAESGEAAFLVAGDPMISTTHVDLRLQAHERGVDTCVIHGTTAAAAAASLTGLQNYRFGKATTLPFPYAHGGGRRSSDRSGEGEPDDADAVPESVLETIATNRERGLHTLVYLDIKVGVGPRGPDPDHEEYMTADYAAELLAGAFDASPSAPDSFGGDELAAAVARAGSDDPVVVADRLTSLADGDFGDPLHLLVIPGDLHPVEREALSALGGAPADAFSEE